MNNQQYWAQRQSEIEQHWHELTARQLRTLKSYYTNAGNEIEKEIAALYAKFARDNALPPQEARKLIRGKTFRQWRFSLQEYVAQSKADPKILRELNTLVARSKISRLEAIHARTLMEIIGLSEKLQDLADAQLARAYLDTYYKSLYDFHKTIGLKTPPAALDSKRVESVLQTPWSGKNYSSRIWDNKSKLVDELKQTLLTAIHRGSTIQKLSKDLSRRMEVAYGNAERLVLTELNSVVNRANAEAMREAEFEYYQFMATLDRRTCARCGERDGEIYKLSEMNQGENAPPLHPRCRCTIVVTLDAPNARSRTNSQRHARDFDDKRTRVPADMAYKDWRAVYIDKTKTLEQWQAEKDFEYKTTELNAVIAKTKTKIAQARTSNVSVETRDKNVAKLRAQLEDYEAQLWKHTRGEDSPYTEARRKAAHYFRMFEQQQADDFLRPNTGKTWRNTTIEQHRAGYQYTFGSGRFNRPLTGFTDRKWTWEDRKNPGEVWINHEGAATMIRDLTKMIEQTTYNGDIWLHRGCSTDALDSFFGFNKGDFAKLTPEQLQDLIGREATMDNFISTTPCKGLGMDGKVMMRIYAPKGTEMIYAEPFSHYGDGERLLWDGIRKQKTLGTEFEVIIQRGATYRVRDITYERGRYEVQLEVRIEAGYNKFQQDPSEWKGSRKDINGKILSVADEQKGTWVS